VNSPLIQSVNLRDKNAKARIFNKEKASIIVYPRIHMFSLDLSIYQGNMSSGSMGFSLLNLPIKITVSKCDVDIVDIHDEDLLHDAKELLDKFRRRFNVADQYKIQISLSENWHHVGLGLTTQIMGGIMLTVGRLSNVSLSYVDLFNLGIGQVSNLGLTALLDTGFMIEFGYEIDQNSRINIHPDLYSHTESPRGASLSIKNCPWQAIIAIPRNSQSLSGKCEEDFWSDLFPDNIESSQKISYMTLNQLIPDIITNNFNDFISALNNITNLGTKPAEEAIQHEKTKRLLSKMRRKFGFASISSLGPTIYTFAEKSVDDKDLREIQDDNFDLVCFNLSEGRKYE
jgi:beta-ribofuranosylaminobenzene 5'-phosphate synthase